MQAYHFERYRNGELMAEGVLVHADDMETALDKAHKLKPRQADALTFVGNKPCLPAVRCPICTPPNG